VREALAILRDVTRAGGGSRDLDVGLELLEKRLESVDSATPELAVLRRRLKGARARSRGRMAEELLDLPISRLRREFAVVVRRRGENLFAVLARLRHAGESGRADLAAVFDGLGDRYEPAALHKLRICARRLRYTAEVLDALKGQDGGAPALFKSVQERLGLIHDAYVLSTWMTRQAGLAESRGELALAAEARRQHETLLEESREQHRRFLAERPRDVLARALDAMGAARGPSEKVS
jgi:CHAD domain-containing protein